MESEELLSKQAQSFLLVIVKGQAKYKGTVKEKKHGFARLQLPFMYEHDRRDADSLVCALSICFQLLELVRHSDWPVHGALSVTSEFLRSATSPILHGSNQLNVLDHLESQKWLNLQTSSTLPTELQVFLHIRTRASFASSQTKLLSKFRSMDCKSSLAWFLLISVRIFSTPSLFPKVPQ